MTFILNGGGGAEQTAAVDATLAEALPRRTLLFIAHATAPNPWSFEKALEWVKEHEAFQGLEITSWVELAGRNYDELDDFDGVYLMGGNTFLLLSVLRSTGMDAILKKFAASKRVIYGISAGAIVLGKNIGTAGLGDEPDENEVGLEDLSGLDLLDGYDVHAHFADGDAEEVERYAGGPDTADKVICIPEAVGMVVAETSGRVVGGSPATLFTREGVIEVPPGASCSLG